MHTPTCTASLTLALLTFIAPAADDYTFAPAEGLRLRRSANTAVEIRSTEVTAYNGDQTQELDVSFAQEIAESLVLLDTVTERGEQGVLGVDRVYESLEHKSLSSAGDEEREIEESSVLEGETVLFRRADAESRFVPELPEDSELDEEVLEGLEFDLDLTALLPRGAVEVDTEYSVDLEHARRLIDLGGRLSFRGEDDNEQVEAAREAVSDDLWANLEGEITATYRGERELEGRTVAHVTFTIEAGGEGEYREEIEDDAMPLASAERVMIRSLHYELSGELHWDVAGQHLHSATLAGEVTAAQDEGLRGETQEGEEVSGGRRIAFEGTYGYELTVEIVAEDGE
jgi:hypothetical protein